jgi:tRNA (adenine22-N1)-methyltransferase
MGYGKRIEELCGLLERAETFADVGCDHGYCTEYMLKNHLCERAIASDVSRGSLAKAERLLASYIADGRVQTVLGDGFFGVPATTDEVLIAGMGGSEIVNILSDKQYGFLPEKFLFQPMHDAEKLRRYLIASGGYIERDYTFRDVKFYDVIKGRRRGTEEPQEYSDLEFEFGRENLSLRPKAFLERTKKQLDCVEKCLTDEKLQEKSRAELLERAKRMKEVLHESDGIF